MTTLITKGTIVTEHNRYKVHAVLETAEVVG